MAVASQDITPQQKIGFIGLGVMGQPMALNLARAGIELVVWNRSPQRCEPLQTVGATIASSVDNVFDSTSIVFVMLLNEAVLDTVLGRNTPDFAKRLNGHILVSMGSNSPEYSRKLEADILAAGGRYIEAPVSGSRKPAEAGQLVFMLGGNLDTVSEIRPLLAPMGKEAFYCGPVGHALLMKLAVNLYLNTTIAGLAEAVHFADKNGLDLTTFQAAINAGPLASDVTRVKIPMLINRDFTVQAATSDAYNSTLLIADAARKAEIATPLLDLSSALYGENVGLGNDRLDMASVIKAIEARTAHIAQAAESVKC